MVSDEQIDTAYKTVNLYVRNLRESARLDEQLTEPEVRNHLHELKRMLCEKCRLGDLGRKDAVRWVWDQRREDEVRWVCERNENDRPTDRPRLAIRWFDEVGSRYAM